VIRARDSFASFVSARVPGNQIDRSSVHSVPRCWFMPAGAGKEEEKMPAKSKKQQMAAGAALSAKRGERSKSSLRGASKQMAQSMSESELEKMASAKRKKLPKRASKKSK
jgi:hypothetical protein